MSKWKVYRGARNMWVALRAHHVEVFFSWDAAFSYAYRHAVAAKWEVP